MGWRGGSAGMSRSASLIETCPECSEPFCTVCEAGKCPVCAWGAGINTDVEVCEECRALFCDNCDELLPCPECDGPLCRECWERVPACYGCRGREEEPEALPQEIEFKYFQIWDGEHRDFRNADPKAWRVTWAEKRPPIAERKRRVPNGD